MKLQNVLTSSREGGRHCFIHASDKNITIYIRKNLRSIKLVDDLPKLSNDPNETQKQTKRIEIHQWTLSSKHMFPMRFAKMIDGTEKPKISSKNKTNSWWSGLRLFIVRTVPNFFAAGLDFSQTRRCQNNFQLDFIHKLHDSLFISFRKLVCNVFELALSIKLCAVSLFRSATWDWLISKFVSFCVWLASVRVVKKTWKMFRSNWLI